MQCLGVYACPEKDCKCDANPVKPNRRKSSTRKPDKPVGDGLCPVHKVPLVHIPCSATAQLVDIQKCDGSKGRTVLHHQGVHKHPRPHEQLSNRAREEFQKVAKGNEDKLPIHFKIGSDKIPPARDIHPALNNIERLTYELGKVRKQREKDKFKLKDVARWESDAGIDFLKKSTLDPKNACFVFQFPEMENIARDNDEYAFQTDTLERWIHDCDYNSMSVTVTSCYSKLLGKHVPVLMSITFGRTAEHYQAHFEVLFRSLAYKEGFDEFKARFPGNISDFSEGERAGFEKAVQSVFDIPNDTDISMEELYTFCTVHFKRSAARVKNNGSVVPIQKQKIFQDCIDTWLKEETTAEDFVEAKNKLIKHCPYAEAWVDWHLEDFRGKLIFPALQNGEVKGFGRDTNAQEGTGRWIKRGCTHDYPSLE